MSIQRSYFNKNNTIIANSLVNTAKNPVTQLFYGKNVKHDCVYTPLLTGNTCNGRTGFTPTVVQGFSRYIFSLDLTDLKNKIGDCCINLTASTATTHSIKMVNTSSFDDSLLNDTVLITDTRRATSFKLMLFKAVYGETWDGGVGYDYQVPDGQFAPEFDLSYSKRPSNWFSATTLTSWPIPGVYLNTVPTTYTVLATQTFDNGNENINFNSNTLTDEINNLLTGTTLSTSANTYGIAFIPDFEQLTGLTEAYSVGFFAKDTQTFFEPYMETYYDDYVNDSRGNFNLGVENRLFLYVYGPNGKPICLDYLPTVTIKDCNGSSTSLFTASTLTCGVYYIDLTITTVPQTSPVLYEDVWDNIVINGVSQPSVENEFIIYDNAFSIGSTVGQPKVYGYSVSGIKEDEKITNGDTRKVFVSTRIPYTVDQQVLVDNIDYRLYVRQGTTEIDVVPWTPVNKSFTHNYFLLDTGWLIPNEYFLDIKATSNQQIDTYRKVIKFQIVNQL